MDNPAVKVAIALGIAARVVFWILAMYIVGSSVWFTISSDDLCLALGKLSLFPVTHFASPFYYDQIPAQVGSWGCHVLSTVFGRLPPID